MQDANLFCVHWFFIHCSNWIQILHAVIQHVASMSIPCRVKYLCSRESTMFHDTAVDNVPASWIMAELVPVCHGALDGVCPSAHSMWMLIPPVFNASDDLIVRTVVGVHIRLDATFWRRTCGGYLIVIGLLDGLDTCDFCRFRLCDPIWCGSVYSELGVRSVKVLHLLLIDELAVLCCTCACDKMLFICAVSVAESILQQGRSLIARVRLTSALSNHKARDRSDL